MIMRHDAALLAALLVLVPLTTVDCSKACTEVGCTDGAGGHYVAEATAADLTATVVEVCRNGVCSTGTPTVGSECVGGATTCSEGLDVRMKGPLPVDVFFVARGTSQPFRETDAWVPAVTPQTTSFDVYVRVAATPVNDGDVYTVTVQKQGAAPILSVQRTASYTTQHPNGEGCAGECRAASLD